MVISNVISNYICAADTNKSNLHSRCSTDSKWRIPMRWLGNIPHPKHTPKSKTRLLLLGTFCSVFCPIIHPAKKPQLFYIRIPAFASHPEARTWPTAGTVNSSPGCPLLTYSAVLSFPWGTAVVPYSLHVFDLDGIWVLLILRQLVTEVFFQRSEDKVWPCQTASQFLWQLSTAVSGWRPLIHLPQAKQLVVTLLRAVTDLCRVFTSGQAPAGCVVLNHSDPTAPPNSKFLQKNGFTECNCMTPLLSLAQGFQSRAADSPSSCTSLQVAAHNFCRIQRLQITSAHPGALQTCSAAIPR